MSYYFIDAYYMTSVCYFTTKLDDNWAQEQLYIHYMLFY